MNGKSISDDGRTTAMSDRFEDRQELAAKIEWEGGLMESLDYGITTEMMPEGDTELAGAWAKLEASFRETSRLADAVQELLDARPLSPADSAPGLPGEGITGLYWDNLGHGGAA